MIGSSMLSALLSERSVADELLRGEIGRKTDDWGISVRSGEIRDVVISRGSHRLPRCAISANTVGSW
jgi:regulator of protease activity HflC (stomatin/prohibitin superfamily)